MKILIMPDGTNWVVDRNCQALVESLPDIEFTIKPYAKANADYRGIFDGFDIVHFFNWDVRWLRGNYPEKPFLISIRSHRYHREVLKLIGRPKTWFHVVNRDLLQDFPGAFYIPNGIFKQFKGRGFTVGYAGHPHETCKQYDGYYLIKQACEEMGVTFKPALNLLPTEMPDYYRSINLYVCASEAEGFSTGVMEALAMNLPVVSVYTGEAKHYVPFTIQRSVEGIKEGIQKFYTQNLVADYRWDRLAPRYREMYEQIHNS